MTEDFEYKSNNQSSSWTLDKGYQITDEQPYPRTLSNPKFKAGFSIVLSSEKSELDYICRSAAVGFKVVLHKPVDFPRVSKEYYRIPLGQDVELKVKPYMMTTSEKLAKYSPETRQCFLENEGNLKFFKIYTQNNCELECLTLSTLSKFLVLLNVFSVVKHQKDFLSRLQTYCRCLWVREVFYASQR